MIRRPWLVRAHTIYDGSELVVGFLPARYWTLTGARFATRHLRRNSQLDLFYLTYTRETR